MIFNSIVRFVSLPLLGLMILLPFRVNSQTIIEIHDPYRGVTYYSMEISTDSLRSLQTKGGQFDDSEMMTMGLSAFIFDESYTIDEYVLWLRHDGPRRWFIPAIEQPLILQVDGDIQKPSPLHISQSTKGAGNESFIEKLEFVFNTQEFQALLDADLVTIELQTVLGAVDKVLSASELSTLRLFDTRVKSMHVDLQCANIKHVDSDSCP